MNRLASKIPTPKISYCPTLGKFNYKNFMSGNKIDSNDEDFIVSIYDYWSTRYNLIPKIDNISGKNDEDVYINQVIRDEIVKASGKDITYVTDVLVKFYYTKRKNSSKKILLGCFGGEMLKNLKVNLANAKPICQVCGKRFKKKTNQNFCSDKCFELHRREYFKNIKREQRS